MLSSIPGDIKYEHLESLIANGVPESRSIEYKASLSISSDRDKKEFLADVSAFANSDGGDLIFGVRASNGIPIEVSGYGGENEDSDILRVESLARDGLDPRILDLNCQFVRSPDGKSVLVVRIAKGLDTPHRVTIKGTSRFFARNSGGKYEMDTREIRELVIAQNQYTKYIRDWCNNQAALIQADDHPSGVVLTPAVLVQLVPLSSTSGTPLVPMDTLQNRWNDLRALIRPGGTASINIDGLVRSYGQPTSAGVTYPPGFVQVFRNGRVVSASSEIVAVQKDNLIATNVVETAIFRFCDLYMGHMADFGITGPVHVDIRLLGISGYRLAVDRMLMRDGNPADRHTIRLPEILMYPDGSPAEVELKPLMDSLWNAFGFVRCEHYSGAKYTGNF